MELTFVAILLALIQFLVMAGKVGAARNEFEVPAPKIIGPDLWERRFRIHQNTMEQLMVFIPSVLIFSYYINDMAAAIIGLLFIISRQWYSHLYMSEPATRGKGFALTFLLNGVLIVGGLVGIGLTYF